MKITNKTKFETRDIKRIYTKVSNSVPVKLPKYVEIRPTRRARKLTCESYWISRESGNPLGIYITPTVTSMDVAILFYEALAFGQYKREHNLEELGKLTRRFQWAVDLPLRIQQPKIITKTDKLQKRLKVLENHLKNWKRKQKLAETKITNYEKEIKSIKRRMERSNGS